MGNWLIGDRSLTAYLEHLDEPANAVYEDERAERYLALCKDALSDAPGSSAGGEQPKFLATRIARHQEANASVPVLVKFSPPMDDRVGRRLGDLLVAEHIAHRVIAAHGVAASKSDLLVVEGRVFLEVVRFDRTRSGGRRGTLSLLALDAEFVGSARTWVHTAERLEQQRIIDADTTRQIRWAQCFGRLIGNSDMHFGNLSLFSVGTRVLGMAPLYDMLPMMYAAPSGHVTEGVFAPTPVSPAEVEVWDSASAAALVFWQTVSRDERISSAFQATSGANAQIVEKWRRVAERGPWS